MTSRLCVLVIDFDLARRSLVGNGLKQHGVDVIAAESLAQAHIVIDEPFEAAVIDSALAGERGGSLTDELLDRLPRSRIIIHGLTSAIPGTPSVNDGDVDAIVQLLELNGREDPAVPARTARQARGRVHRQWLELCRWDPALPPNTRPPIAETLITAVTKALERPQPLGWGLDPALEPVAAAFGLNVGDVQMALAELVCLRESFARVVIPQLQDDQRVEGLQRLQMIIDRTMLVVAESGVRRLASEAMTDALTGLGNRRAFEQDMRRELARVSRSGAGLTVALLDLDGLKRINDTYGHPAGDQTLRQMAHAILSATRASDRGYRVGGDEFALLLADARGMESADLRKRLQAAGAPKFTLGTASVPPDDPERLVNIADQRLYAQRQRG